MGLMKIWVRPNDFKFIEQYTTIENADDNHIHENSREDIELNSILTGQRSLYDIQGILYDGTIREFSYDHGYTNQANVKVFTANGVRAEFFVSYLDEMKKKQLTDSLTYQLKNSRFFDAKWQSHGEHGTEKVVLSAYRIENGEDVTKISIDGVEYMKSDEKKAVYHAAKHWIYYSDNIMSNGELSSSLKEEVLPTYIGYRDELQKWIDHDKKSGNISAGCFCTFHEIYTENKDDGIMLIPQFIGRPMNTNVFLKVYASKEVAAEVGKEFKSKYLEWYKYNDSDILDLNLEYEDYEGNKNTLTVAIRRAPLISFISSSK